MNGDSVSQRFTQSAVIYDNQKFVYGDFDRTDCLLTIFALNVAICVALAEFQREMVAYIGRCTQVTFLLLYFFDGRRWLLGRFGANVIYNWLAIGINDFSKFDHFFLIQRDKQKKISENETKQNKMSVQIQPPSIANHCASAFILLPNGWCGSILQQKMEITAFLSQNQFNSSLL